MLEPFGMLIMRSALFCCCVILHNLLIARGDYDSVFSDCDDDISESKVESDDSGDGDGDDEMRTGNIRDALATYLASLSVQ